MIDLFNSISGRVSDALLYPFMNMNPWVAMVVISLLTAVLMLLVYRLTSNPARIRTIKDRIMAHLLEIRLYKESLPVTFKAQGNILWWNLKYLGHSLRPMLVLIIPLVLAIFQLDLRFGYQPLSPGQSAIVKVRLKEAYRPSREDIGIEASPGIMVETPALRIDQGNEVDWRVLARQTGIQELAIRVNNRAAVKSIAVGTGSLSKVSPTRVSRNSLEQLANPGETAIADLSPVQRIDVAFPTREMSILGWHIHWLIVYFVLSVIFGFALKGVFKVEL